MQTPNIQLFLMTGLAIGFGSTITMALQARDAVGYPGGTAVSMGSNPVVSVGGEITGSSSVSAMTSPTDQALIITDVVLVASDQSSSCRAHTTVYMRAGTEEIARFAVGTTYDTRNYSNWAPLIDTQFSSGLRVPPDTELFISTGEDYSGGCSGSLEVVYTLSGYYAQP